MPTDPAALAARVVEHLRRNPAACSEDRAPHPHAGKLRLPDRSPAPPSLAVWAAFDHRYPWYLSSRRSPQIIADERGRVLAQPMRKLLRWVCLDSIRDELEGDDETIAYLKELSADLAAELPGYGVYLEPQEQPDRLLWLPPGGEAVVLWYEDDAIARREPFAEYLVGLFDLAEETLEFAEEAWRGGRPLDAGRVLYERLAVEDRPAWALAVLEACYAGQASVPREVEAVREIARDPSRWTEAHDAFSAVRSLVLRNQKGAATPTDVAGGLLYLAENVAKVTYNARGAPAPFDYDAGWWVASCARWVVDRSQDPDLDARVWAALTAMDR